MDIALHYLGCSGFHVDRGRGSALVLDPPSGAAIPDDRPLHVLITHGHPEHLGGTRRHLDDGNGKAPATVCASPDICRYLARHCRRSGVEFRAVRPGERIGLDAGLEFEVFRWTHLPLLPPGLRPALAHLARLASRPGLAARIVAGALAGPRPGPMLGFRLFVDGAAILAFGEGLHRLCSPAEAAAGSRGCGGGTLLVAVEPEDAARLPALIAATGLSHAVLYEPHAEWRNAFRMPRPDLAALIRILEAQGIHAEVARPLSRD